MNYFKNEKIIANISSHVRDAILMAIAFPNTYSIAMTSLGYQTAWKLFNQNENVKAVRWFTDIKESCRGLMNQTPTYVGFSFSWELDYKNIFEILEKNNIPLSSTDRKEDDPLIFCGGQVPNANPEPFCDNFDFFLLGDLEEIAEGFINKIVEIKDLSRQDKLSELAKLPGVYMPGKDAINRVSTKRQISKNDLSSSSILTPDSVWPNAFIVEVVRSCPELCKFCLASYGSLPFRKPNLKNGLIPAIDHGLQFTNKIGLLGASVTQHPEFEGLIEYLLTKKNLSVQIASIRADTISQKITNGLHKLGAKSLTMAVETGSERLRDIINKKVNNETIKNSIDTIYNAGFNSVKLYGMVGLPGETQDDLDKTVSFLGEIKKKNKTKKLIWGCSVFVPKATTPFQWQGMDKDADKKIKYLKKELHKIGVDFRPESFEWACIQGLISRSDRSINKILVDAYKYGSTLGSFKKAIRENKHIDSDYFMFTDWDKNTKLPWDNIQGYLSKDIIKSQSLLGV